MNPSADFTPLGLFLAADVVVKAVMVALTLASLACWTVIVEKLLTLRRLREEVRGLAGTAAMDRIPMNAGETRDLASSALRAGLTEWGDSQGERETDGEYRGRIDAAARKAVGRSIRQAGGGLQLLATTGSVAPFVGLFGTVWGIMNSFSGIAASNDTSLAVVAPGIAEALFATAIGLVAAIPAVIAYNRLSAAVGLVRSDALAAAGELAHRLARSRPLAAASGPASSAPPSRRITGDGRCWQRAQAARTKTMRLPMAEMNVTPLVDVMLVLLIVFMVAAPMMMVGVPVQLPRTSAARVAHTAPPVVVTVGRDGRLFLGRDAVMEAELGAKLTGLRAQAPTDAPVYVRGDRSVPYGDVMRVMGRVSAAGVARVSLIAEGESGAPAVQAR